MFDKVLGRPLPHATNLVNVCVEKDFHRIVDPEALREPGVEPLNSILFEHGDRRSRGRQKIRDAYCFLVLHDASVC